jgi:hypothetical protein
VRGQVQISQTFHGGHELPGVTRLSRHLVAERIQGFHGDVVHFLAEAALPTAHVPYRYVQLQAAFQIPVQIEAQVRLEAGNRFRQELVALAACDRLKSPHAVPAHDGSLPLDDSVIAVD